MLDGFSIHHAYIRSCQELFHGILKQFQTSFSCGGGIHFISHHNHSFVLICILTSPTCLDSPYLVSVSIVGIIPPYAPGLSAGGGGFLRVAFCSSLLTVRSASTTSDRTFEPTSPVRQ